MKKVVVIGAGAAGLMAAYAAAKNGNDVTVYEKNEKSGKKIYITGKGRCNFTNDCDPNEFFDNVVKNAKFLTSAIYSLTPQKVIDFFENGGMATKVERGARAFPLSDKASDVTKCLENYCKKAGVKFIFNTKVLKINTLNGTMCGITTENEDIFCDCVVVCTGGLSYPSTGSTGDGYEFAKSVGHEIIEPKPALCGINLKGDYCKQLQGLSLKNVGVSVFLQNKLLRSFFGEMLFTHYGVSGPIILSVSSLICRQSLSSVKIILDLKPALTDEQLDKRILRDFEEYKNKSISNCLKELLPISLIPVILKRSLISVDKKVNAITREERVRLLTNIKNFDMLVASLRDFSEAIITSGGVEVKKINPKTMESKLVNGLYFCGEVLDVDAFTGGFNLQIAFATGFAAGNSIK
ncbi:MAG: NAD(P)/FAD-dependent oxidoreductase [Clostridiales bacterium]|nr:NAD(P)/FAD-dependent oxidoreductase [Clostridiales bacterium]